MRYVLAAAVVACCTAASAQDTTDKPAFELQPVPEKLGTQVIIGGGATFGIGTLGLGEDGPPDPDRPAPPHPAEDTRPAGGFILSIPVN